MILELTRKGAEFTKHIPSIECFFSSKENVTVDRIRPDKITLIVPKGTTSDNVNAISIQALYDYKLFRCRTKSPG